MIGAVTGFSAEAVIAQRIGLLAAAGGGTQAGTERAVARLLGQGVSGLVSFGIAGGIAPGLRSGDLVLPGALRSQEGEAYWVDLDWHGRLTAAAQERRVTVTVGGMLGLASAAVTAAEKAELHRGSGAVAVDLESHRVAAAAARARIPFIVFRVVADTAERDLPPAARLPLREDGRPDLGGVFRSLAREPAQLPAVLRIAGETGMALWALFRQGRALASALTAF